MSLLSIENVETFSLTIKFREENKDYVRKIISDVPIGNLKTESIEERRDMFQNIYDVMPRYRIHGAGISFEFSSNKFSVRIGTPSFPEELAAFEMDKKDSNLFQQEILSKLSIDTNYLLGIIMSITGELYDDIKLSTRTQLKKENGVSVSFLKIINEVQMKEIGDNVNVTGIVIKNEEEDKLTYTIRDSDGKLSVTILSEFNTTGSLDIYEIIENQIITLNDILLKV